MERNIVLVISHQALSGFESRRVRYCGAMRYNSPLGTCKSDDRIAIILPACNLLSDSPQFTDGRCGKSPVVL